MSWGYWAVPVILGAVFIVIGIGLIIWGVRESTDYYDSLINGFDLREFFSKWPPRAEPAALKAGGWISIALGLVFAGFGFLLYWLNR